MNLLKRIKRLFVNNRTSSSNAEPDVIDMSNIDDAANNMNNMNMGSINGTNDVNRKNGFTIVKEFGSQLGTSAIGLWNTISPESKKVVATVLAGSIVLTSGIAFAIKAHKPVSNNNSYSTSDTDYDTDLSSNTKSEKVDTKDTPSETEDIASIETADTPSIETEDTPSIETEDTPSIETEDTPSIETEDTPSIETEDTPSIDTEDTPSIEIEDTPSIETEDTPVSKDKESKDDFDSDIPFDISFEEYYDLYDELTNNNNNSTDIAVNENDTQDINNIELGSKITIKDGSKIYDDVYDSSYENNELNPYFDGDMERTVFCIAFEYEGNLVYCDMHDADAQAKVDFLKQNGAKIMSVMTSVDGVGYEGAYNIKSVSKVLVNDNAKQLVK